MMKMMMGGDSGADPGVNARLARNARYVKVHPTDDCIGVEPLFLTEDPTTFTPRVDAMLGYPHVWGTSIFDADNPLPPPMMRLMVTQGLYGRVRG